MFVIKFSPAARGFEFPDVREAVKFLEEQSFFHPRPAYWVEQAMTYGNHYDADDDVSVSFSK